MKKYIILFLILFLSFIPFIKAETADLALNSKSAILIEASTGKILFEKNSREKMAPASMTKIMTMLLIMEELDSNNISLNDQVYISDHAAGMGGSQIFIPAKGYMKVEDLLKGIAIASGNDAATAMAEHIGGTEENFVNMMNEKATKLGLVDTNFKNPHGLDEANHYTTAYDLAIISKELLKHESITNYTSIYEEYLTINNEKRWLVNTNSLIRFYEGVDGLKTGFTEDAKYCLTSTMKRSGMRLISVVMGVETKELRSKDTVSMMEYGYSMYGIKTLFPKVKSLGQVYISKSKDREYNYFLETDVNLVLDKNTKDINYDYKIELTKPSAPLNKGDKVGELKLNYNGEEIKYNLIINEQIKKASFLRVFINYFKDIISGKVNVIK